MHKRIHTLLFTVLLLVSASCTKEKDDPAPVDKEYPGQAMQAGDEDQLSLEPMPVQYALAIAYTATWCGPCGNWGMPMLHDLNEMAPGRVLSLAIHVSGDPMLIPSLYDTLLNDRTHGGAIPAFWIGDLKPGSSNDFIQNTQNILALNPSAGMDYLASRTDSFIDVVSQVRFFTDMKGPFYLSTFVLESGIDGSQSAGIFAQYGTSDPDYTHDFVLRAAAAPGAYGAWIADSAIAGQRFDRQDRIPSATEWGDDVYVATVLWRYDWGTEEPHYKFVNAFFDKNKVQRTGLH